MGSWVVEMQATKSIYKVPPFISKINEIAYKPQLVSFGPYHHGDPQLVWMEAHKRRALLRFIDRSRRNEQEVYDIVAEMAQHLKDSYDSLESEWQENTKKFVQLMILDGCFMFEVLHVYQHYDYYSDNDPVFSQHGELYVMQLIRADMLMLENQLPMSLLIKLKEILDDAEGGSRRLPVALLDYNSSEPIFSRMLDSEIVNCLHVLDVYRKGLLLTHNEQGNSAPQLCTKIGKCLHKLDLYCKGILRGDVAPKSPNEGEENKKRVGPNIVRPATELREAGVHFMQSERKSLRDITFDDGVLKIPNFTVDDYTESTFLNLIAFERCHILSGRDITSFVAFMDDIIDDSRDIKLLSSKGIIDNVIGSDKEAADLFNKMSKNLILELDGKLGKVYEELIDYCNTPWHKWRANLSHTYFRNPWAIISIIAAFVLFSLTAVQTIFTILN